MLLAIDIGNTAIHLGIFQAEQLIYHQRFGTDTLKTIADCRKLLRDLEKQGEIKDVIISSVVPKLLTIFKKSIAKHLRLSPLVVNSRTKTGLAIKYPRPQELGADRIVNAAAAHKLYSGPVIIIDFGTATTFCALSGKGDYLGGIIAPGIGLSAEALAEKTALLPQIELTKPVKIIGESTEESMNSGIIYGFAALIDGLIVKMKKEFSHKARVIATGGWVELIAPESDTIDEVVPLLTLKGLKIIYEINRKKRKT